MEPIPYKEMSDLQLLALCIWREACFEGNLGKRAVGCVVRNRLTAGKFYGGDWKEVILKPYQFRSFDSNDARSAKWPVDVEESWLDSLDAAADVCADCEDPTRGALYFCFASSSFPPYEWKSAGAVVHIGNLIFYKPLTQDAITGVTNDLAQ